VLQILPDLGFTSITTETIKKGLATASNPGRLEFKSHAQLGEFFLDGAHNEDGIVALARHLTGSRAKLQTGQGIAFIFGLSGNKDSRQLLNILCCEGDTVRNDRTQFRLFPFHFRSRKA
jgi:folylpolyglutamate synthase/dihydropteroate synthase